eukprot:221453_1
MTNKKENTKPILIKSIVIKATNYKEKPNEEVVGFDQFDAFYVNDRMQGAYLYEYDINIDLYCKAMAVTLNEFPFFSSRIKQLKNNYFILSNKNEGVKLDIMCLPQYSLFDIKSLQHIFKGNNGSKIFFEPLHKANKTNEFLLKGRIIYFNRSPKTFNLNNNDHKYNQLNGGCLLTFDVSHIVIDGYSGQLFREYLSNSMSNIINKNNQKPELYKLNIEYFKTNCKEKYDSNKKKFEDNYNKLMS